MKIRHERPMSELEYAVQAPLYLEGGGGAKAIIPKWSLSGFELNEELSSLEGPLTLVIPFQGIDLRFPVSLEIDEKANSATFVGLTGRQRETLALFYRNLLSGKMAATEDIITSLDTPVDLVPMEETEEEEASGKAKTAPRFIRAIISMTLYWGIATFVFGILGFQIWDQINKVDVQHGRIIAAMASQTNTQAGFVETVHVVPGQEVKRGDLLVTMRDSKRVAALEKARTALIVADTAEQELMAELLKFRRLVGQATNKTLVQRFAEATRLQIKFFGSTNITETRRLWLAARQQTPEIADSLRPDKVTLDRLEALLLKRRLEADAARRLAKVQEQETAAMNVLAQTDGIVSQVLAVPGTYLGTGTQLIEIEGNTARIAVGWASERLSKTLYVGMPGEITYNVKGERKTVEATVVDIMAGENPTRPGEFGILVSFRADVMDSAETRQVFRRGAPVALTGNKELLKGVREYAVEVGAPLINPVIEWVTDLVSGDDDAVAATPKPTSGNGG